MTCSVRQRKNKSLPYTLAKRETQRASHGWTILPSPSQSVYCPCFHLFLKIVNQRRHSLDALVWKLTINEELILVLFAPPFQALVPTVHSILAAFNYWLWISHCFTSYSSLLHTPCYSFIIPHRLLLNSDSSLHTSRSSLFIFLFSFLTFYFFMLTAHCWIFTHSCLLVLHCSHLLTVPFSVFTTHSLQLRCLLLITHFSLLDTTGHSILTTGFSPLIPEMFFESSC